MSLESLPRAIGGSPFEVLDESIGGMDKFFAQLGEVQQKLFEKEKQVDELLSEHETLQAQLAAQVDVDNILRKDDDDMVSLREENKRLKQEKNENGRWLEEAELEYEHKKSESAVLPHEYEDLQEEVDTLKNDHVASTKGMITFVARCMHLSCSSFSSF